VEVIGTQVH